jgi:hypothetical protein
MICENLEKIEGAVENGNPVAVARIGLGCSRDTR